MGVEARKGLPLLLITVGAMVMVWVAQLTGHIEIVMPTYGALMTGAWLFEDNLWHYRRMNLLMSLTLAAALGLEISVLAQHLGGWWTYPAIYVGFLLTAWILVIGRTQIYPCFGAAMLPVIMGTTSWLYPISVCVLASVLLGIQWALEKGRLRAPLNAGEFSDLPEQRKDRALYYFKISTGLVPLLVLIPVCTRLGFSDCHLLLQAPLFVTYTTFCNARSTFVRYPVQTWIQLAAAALFGTLAQFAADSVVTAAVGRICATTLGVGLSVAATLFCGRFFIKRFPPAISMAITPFLVPDRLLPLFVAVSAAYLIFISWVFRRHPAYESMDLKYL